MAYREAEKPEAKTVQLFLTRREVHGIVRKHLRDTGKIPKDAKLGRLTLSALTPPDAVQPPDVNGKPAP